MSYSGYYSSKNCCVKSKCPTPCPTGPTGPIGPIGPSGVIGPTGPTGPKGIDLSGNCFGDYIYWDTNTNAWVVGSDNIRLGCGAGETTQGQYSVAVGFSTGNENQGTKAVAIGYQAGLSNQGNSAIAIGFQAGMTNQPNNSIIINATNSILNGSTTDACYIKPIRNNYNNKILLYDTIEGEVTYSSNNNPFDASGNLNLFCNLIQDVSGIYFCDGTYIGHGSSFDISSSEVVHLKSDQDVIIEPNNLLAVKGTLDMCGNKIIDLSLNYNEISSNPFMRYNPSTQQMSYKSMNYASLSCDLSQNITAGTINTVIPLFYNKIDISNGIYYDNITPAPSHIKFTQNGVYKIGTSIQFAKSQGNQNDVYLWFKDASGNIPRSSSIVNLDNGNSKTFNYVEIIYEITNTSTQYVEIVMLSGDVHIYALAQPSITINSNTIPAIPSIITTVIQIA